MSADLALIADTIRFSNVDGPGNRFVVFMQGCNFDCVACHNPHTIDLRGVRESDCGEPPAVQMGVADLIREIRKVSSYISGLTVSGGEATLQADFVRSLFEFIKADTALNHLNTLIDSNGSVAEPVWSQLAPVMDGAMIDLKSFDDRLHVEMTSRSNAAVLRSIEHLSGINRLHEVRMLIIPGLNDDAALLTDAAEWLVDLCPLTRVRLIGFRRHGVRSEGRRYQEPSADHMSECRELFVSAGLADVVTV